MYYIFYMMNVLYILYDECLTYFIWQMSCIFYIMNVWYILPRFSSLFPLLSTFQHWLLSRFIVYIYNTVITVITNLFKYSRKKVTGVNLDLACVAIFVVCVFYTTAGSTKSIDLDFDSFERKFTGGMKAVVWTDVFQLVPILINHRPFIVLTGVYVPFHWIHHRGCHNGSRRAICCLRKGSTGHLDRGVDDDDLDGAHCSWWWHPQLWESPTSPYLNPCLKLPFSYYYATFSRGVGAFQNSLSFP